ncbi:oligosaccharide flippase family protein [Alkalihalobacillus macyae]|uniref:lipopolysaccharide biosynthesis protein n=1 Tax=Guptibacillus hwajinpoensis TaxID=208199 RepID=UPI00273CEB8A|nr:oligosaccharide flippase family protein [Alkalihalobacillus macyae]MDP4551666.1 oligosaccharide flippase family protein [Alkalihalobacillus macyae]
MRKSLGFKRFYSNLVFAFIAQLTSFLLSATMALIVPKILGLEGFGYFQLYIFYTSYVGLFHLGLNDGIYLKNGGAKYNELNFEKIGPQFWVAFLFHSFLAVIIIVLSIVYIDVWDRIWVYILTAISIPLINSIGFLGYIFQAVNKTKIFSISVIIDKLFFILALTVMLVLKSDNFIIFIVLNILGKVISLFYCLKHGSRIIFVKMILSKEVFKEIFENVSVGVNLLFSNLASLLIIGFGRFVVDRQWGITEFSKLSLALTLATFLLAFITQISMVLFPALHQSGESQRRKFYVYSREFLGVTLSGLLLLYFPLKYFLYFWLPEYQDSLIYLIILLPLCSYEGKMNMLCTTYFKVMRKEKYLLKINFITLVISVILSYISGFIVQNILAVTLSILISIAFRSIISEIYLSKLMQSSVLSNIVKESTLVIVFIISNWYFDVLISFYIYLLAYMIFLLSYKKVIIRQLGLLRKIVKG